MKETIYIKNMVCNRCISSVLAIFTTENYTVESVELGKVVAVKGKKSNAKNLNKALENIGFERIENRTETLVEQIKVKLIHKLERGETEDLFQILGKEFGKTETAISKLFSKHEGVTLEKYTINLKIEKVKELIQLGQLNFSEIAYTLNYKTSSHLARQFKGITGMSMSDYKSLQEWDRKFLDQIV
ncbi:helix-turn-helix domain-containing protein [Cellulophaga sp. F20128]|uniref:helix-turn-helix domain-containing protein n=1 Tax=Cellulophaga sp. F20128 TaxID=2926413 RepID=UPI001FF56B68|nr:helix-turn-helix domain-containing protein [Cellulophaga sp. F20128]MCK0156142.1 helix-turn-helix domain-containing protein [Cellulophaga sp. F20128]